MTPTQEREMHVLAKQLADLTERTGWEMSRYRSISWVMEMLASYCATCDCQREKKVDTVDRKHWLEAMCEEVRQRLAAEQNVAEKEQR